ncbi:MULTISPECIES: sugar ABC transporter ATP-binding protein [Aminobacter]|uniref:sugar ABC transporter ATP-binding protein n=1 Tax=Aminobacter TaxID=31988 RepID=UPI0012B042E3|nr:MULTISPECIES: sugar ABC transporter ATP-binding protein [Aminobacter]MDR7224627.1 ribose transport system ATP-binding protein [Aminobacter aminovorans]MRX37311.1 ATP-binding cassette domain-containing protein [Aminobacter sp. MDW-2]QNH33920.1 sugar ABC transporter ATP-binding protein [Aminobacter sp. MDW-2]
MTFAVKKLCKAYGGVDVLKSVNLAVEDGEIHALLGANGAGKSTLIKCLSGAITPDGGEIKVGEQHYKALTPKLSRDAGIAVVYQELSLVMSLDVADNVFLGREVCTGPFVHRSKQRSEAISLLSQMGIALNPATDLSEVSSAELQAIEIVKALSARPKVLILDEPTASLSEREAERLGENLKQLRKQNLPVLYVTHRLNEVFDLADRVTVLRGGEVVLSGRVDQLSHDELVHAIVGKNVFRGRARQRQASHKCEKPLLAVKNVVSPGIGPISFDVFPGEVVGVFGLVGSGRTELLDTLFGVQPLHSGTITLNGESYVPNKPADAVSRGVALVPSDRLRRSIFQSLSALENALLSTFRHVSARGLRKHNAEAMVFSDVAERLNLQPRRMDLEAQRFSGGNQQKLVLARWLNDTQECRLLLLDEPTQGVDVGARREIYDAIQLVSSNPSRAVIATSSEPDELMQIATRVIVLSGGKIAGIVSGDDINETTLIGLAHKIEHREDIA